MAHDAFALTPALLDKILEALETQGKVFAVDASSSSLVEVTGGDPFPPYPLPEWGSDRGYALREDFVHRLHAPIAADELDAALHSGRGAFRAFKDAIKSFPQVERVWHRYKRQQMASYVWVWYDELCDEWGQEHLSHTEDDALSTKDLLKEDFSFAPLAGRDMADVKSAIIEAAAETSLPSAVGLSVVSMWRRRQEDNAGAASIFFDDESRPLHTAGVVCRTIDGEYAGGLTWEESSARQSAVVTSIAVARQWRGLGIASALLEECFARLASDWDKEDKESGNRLGAGRYVIFALPITSGALEALMQKMGAEACPGLISPRFKKI